MSRPWMKWYPKDWRADPRLRMCSLAARGLWIELIGYMHEAEPYGHMLIDGKVPGPGEIASLVGRPMKEVRAAMQELDERGVYSSTGAVIYSRRMVRDKAKTDQDVSNGKNGGHPDIRRGTVAKEDRVRRFRKSDAPEKAKRIFDRSRGTCHWCQKKLDEESYHIDHVIAVRDGGTNDEGNLVAACPDCNGERAMTWGRSDTDLRVGFNSDLKAQIPEARSQEPERKEDAPDGATTPTKKYAFESGVIRLNERDFSNWKASFSHLDVPAELIGLTEWAGKQGQNWFFAVSGALAKKNREIGTQLEAGKNPSDFKWKSGIPGVL